jgi:4-hydroxybenzoate polyprenyltransferase
LSFDTAIGAVLFTYIFGEVLQLGISEYVYMALFISVLCIYNTDHLLDAISLKASTKSYRHAFYQRHLKVLVLWQLFLMITGLIVVYHLPVRVFLWGLLLLIVVGVYFWVIFRFKHHRLILREVVVGLGYVVAVGILPFVGDQFHLNLELGALLGIVFLIALLNLWIFSLYDIGVDSSQNHHSIAREIGRSSLIRLVRIVLGIAFILTIIYAVYSSFWWVSVGLLVIEISYLILLEKPAFFKTNEGYRLIGEMVLFVPGVAQICADAI